MQNNFRCHIFGGGDAPSFGTSDNEDENEDELEFRRETHDDILQSGCIRIFLNQP